MLIENNRRLVLRYNPGQFTFRNFLHTATDAQLYDLAIRLNGFQDQPVAHVLKVQTFEML